MAVLSGPLLSREATKHARKSGSKRPPQSPRSLTALAHLRPTSPTLALGLFARPNQNRHMLCRLTDKCLVLPHLNKVSIPLQTSVDSAAALLNVQQDENQLRLRTKVKI